MNTFDCFSLKSIVRFNWAFCTKELVSLDVRIMFSLEDSLECLFGNSINFNFRYRFWIFFQLEAFLELNFNKISILTSASVFWFISRNSMSQRRIFCFQYFTDATHLQWYIEAFSRMITSPATSTKKMSSWKKCSHNKREEFYLWPARRDRWEFTKRPRLFVRRHKKI